MVTMTPPVRVLYKRLLGAAKKIGPERAHPHDQVGHRHHEPQDLQAAAGVGEPVAP